MASHQHQLAIAKASLSASLLRPDPTPIPRDDIAHFHTLLNAVITQCTSENVQKCKRWIFENVIKHERRYAALGNYLVVLSRASQQSSATQKDSSAKREPSARRKRLHVLYLINDILHHAKFHTKDLEVASKVQPNLQSLFGAASSFKGCLKHQRKITDLLDIWAEKDYYSKQYMEELRQTVNSAQEAGEYVDKDVSAKPGQDPSAKAAKTAPYMMPAMHGDPSTPWFDLPAGNLLQHIIPNSTRPINPDMIKPLRLQAGPADESLVLAVEALMDDVRIMYGEGDDGERVPGDIGELGQPLILDEITGDVVGGDGYYGWSRNFCEKMKRRKKGLDLPDTRGGRSESRSSSPEMRKRRHSDSDSSEGGYRSRRRQRSYSSSRSPSPGPRNGSRSYSRHRDITTSNSRSNSPRNAQQTALAQESIPPNQGQGLPPRPPMSNIPPPPPFQQSFNPSFPPPPPPQFMDPSYGGGPDSQYGNSASQHCGIWPPPPPPPLIHNMPPNVHQAFQGMQNAQFSHSNQQFGGWPQPPPPPPPPPGNPPPQYQQQGQFQKSGQFQGQNQWQQQQQGGQGCWQQGNGRGGYNNNNGRGGYNSGNGWNNAGRGGKGSYRGRGYY